MNSIDFQKCSQITNSIVPLFPDFFFLSLPAPSPFFGRQILIMCCPCLQFTVFFALVSECWDCRCVSLYLASYFIFFKVYFILLNYVCLWVSLPPLVLAPLPRLGHGVGVLLPIHAGVLAGVVCR